VISSGNTLRCLEVQWTTGRRYRISEEGRFLLEMPRKAKFLKQAEQFEDDYNDNNYSNYVEDVSVHAVTNIRLGCSGQHLYMIIQYSQRLAPC